MSVKARILIVGNGAKDTKALAATLSAAGYDSRSVQKAKQALVAARKDRPDVVVINSNGGAGLDHAAAVEFLTALKGDPETASIPVVLIGTPAGAEDEAKGFAAGASTYLSRPYHDVQLLARLGALVRIATMKAELERRAETTRRYGLDDLSPVPQRRDAGDVNVLVLAGDAGSVQAIETILGRDAVLTYAWSTATALDYLVRRRFDAMVISIERDDPDIWELCADIRHNARLYNLPIVVIAARETLPDAEKVFKAGVSDLLYRPLQGQELSARIDAFVQEERYRAAMHRVYREARHFLTSDALTGLYSYGFAMDHLGRAIEHAASREKSLTVGLFDIRNMATINAEYGYAAGDKIIRQIGNLIANLVRGEDLPARLGGDEFCVILPDTDRQAASVVIDRIANVIQVTEFLLRNSDDPIHVRVRSGAAGYEDGDTPKSLITRARAAMG